MRQFTRFEGRLSKESRQIPRRHCVGNRFYGRRCLMGSPRATSTRLSLRKGSFTRTVPLPLPQSGEPGSRSPINASHKSKSRKLVRREVLETARTPSSEGCDASKRFGTARLRCARRSDPPTRLIRWSIRLGKMPQRTAETVKLRVELLNAAAIAGHASDDETARWVAGLEQRLADKLAAVGLIPKRQAATLQAFLDGYVASRQDVKGTTATVDGHTRRNLIDYFGADKPLRDITPGDADQWRLCLVAEKLETELAETYPIHVVCKWIGNTQAVAATHYLQVTDEHFQQGASVVSEAVQNPVHSVQNPVQQAAAAGRTASHEQQKTPVISGVCETLRQGTICLVGDEGLRPPTPSV